MSTNTPFALVILDGFGLNPSTEGNAVYTAKTPNFDKLWETCPSTTLETSGERVGLPEGQMGNSEVGHLNIGAGRVVYQDLSRINSAIANDQLVTLDTLDSLARTTVDGATIHLAGLLSTGGVHSSLEHVTALVQALAKLGALRIRLHCFTDGRDRPPQSGKEEVAKLTQAISSLGDEFPSLDVAVASICGRYYAMDRDKRWERTQQAYELMTQSVGVRAKSVEQAFDTHYGQDCTDEFIPPTSIVGTEPDSNNISDGDSLLFFNFRADRMKQICETFFAADFNGFERKSFARLQHFVSLTQYDETYPIEPLFGPQTIENHLGQVISKAGLSQVRIAETEKYAHVTYFFNGGDENASPGEERIMIPSRRDVATYDQVPEMSAHQVCDSMCSAISENKFDVYIVNFANCDMVGHTGDFDAAVKACETVDQCLGEIVEAMNGVGGTLLVTADHGNADQMIEYDTHKPHTYHTTHPVPLILVSDKVKANLKSGGALCDISPSILEILGLAKPAEMTGSSLLKKA